MRFNQTHTEFQDSKGRKTAAILTMPSDGADRAVILCHGFLSNKNSNTNRRLTDLLVSKGISTLRFDWFGMGESEGNFADLKVSTCCDQLERAWELIHCQHSRIGLIGSSYGGLISILFASHHPDLRGLGLKCPVPDFPEMLRLEFGDSAMNQWKRLGEIPNVTGGDRAIQLHYGFYEDCLQYDAFSSAKAIKTPVVIVHGDQDEFVPLRQIQQLEDSLDGNKQLHLLPGANHHFGKPEDFRKMTTLLTDWMVTTLSG